MEVFNPSSDKIVLILLTKNAELYLVPHFWGSFLYYQLLSVKNCNFILTLGSGYALRIYAIRCKLSTLMHVLQYTSCHYMILLPIYFYIKIY